MRPSSWKYAALAFLLVPVVASAEATPAAFALDPSAATSFTAASAPSLATNLPLIGGISYQPRGHYRDNRNWSMPTWTQVHVGFYDPSDNFGTSFNGGARMGPMVDPHVQIGVGLDWWHRENSETQDLGSVELPGGSGTAQVELSKSTADLVPVMAFMQVSGDENMPLIPYGGAAVGYEWLVVSADHPDGSSFDETFGGFGWQMWGGAALPLSGQTRLNGELFYNYCEPENNDYVTDAGLPVTLRVKMSGVGMRFGVSWGF